MRYSVGTCLADFGFGFFEKLQAPIFLVHRLGKVSKMNEAGRKLLNVAHLNYVDLNEFAGRQIARLFQNRGASGYRRLSLSRRLNLVAHALPDSDYILVEIRHRRAKRH